MIQAITGATRIVTNGLKKNLEAITGKTFNRFTTKKKSCTCNITHNTEGTAV
jgi:outer membrane protein assembly factor BamA